MEQQPFAGRRGRSTLALGLLAATALTAAPIAARAQATFDRLTAFGDSYADNGNVQRLLRGETGTYPSSTTDPSVSYNTFPLYVQQLYGIPDANVRNYAIGGATTTSVNASAGRGLSLPFELQTFAARGERIGPREIVLFSIGGNDGGASSGSVPLSLAASTAATANANSLAGVNQLVAAGARNIVFRSTSDLGALASVRNGPNPAGSIEYGRLYFEGLQRDLAPLGDRGVRVFLFDTGRLLRAVQANPAAYGFTDAQTPCNTFAACRTPNSPLQQQYLTYDGLHLTSKGFELVARYIAAQVGAPDAIAVTPEIGLASVTAFTNSVFERLDTYRFAGMEGRQALAGTGMGGGGSAPVPVAPGSPVSVFVQGHYAAGDRDRRNGVAGYSYDLGGITLGGEVRPVAGVRIGLAFNYSNTNADIDAGLGKVEADSYRAAIYGSVTRPNWFVDGVVTAGRDVYETSRTGVISAVRGDPTGSSASMGLRGGYLVNAGPVRLGPIGGLTYTWSRSGNYTESGDGLLTNDVRRQTIDALTGSLGAQARLNVTVAGRSVTPYVNVTAEHDFIGRGRTLITNATFAQSLPVRSQVEERGRTYGQVAGGISAEVVPGVAVMANAGTTFARRDGNDYAFWGGVRLTF
ncbi:autotransporter domain-containing protein [Pararoseomonas sp. SCSIO 73927]|uniref:autotransporter domain-containing protein n=1 Tax=Pararoseomonas sp. SCSIO 73927 TaxID=3114537 RepID=UPI0030D16588